MYYHQNVLFEPKELEEDCEETKETKKFQNIMLSIS